MEKIRVLLVDDEVEFASALAERLQLRNYDVKAVFCAEDALALARTNPPHVMVLDLKLPGMDGTDIFRAVKQFAPFVEVVFLTGHGALPDTEEGNELSGFDFATKPVEISELMEKINRARERQKQKP